MKVKVTTLTGDKHELEVAPHETVRNLKKLLYQSGEVTSQVRLFQGQTVLEDDRKLCEYSLQEGTTISALFEPDVDINIEVSTGKNVHKLIVSNATSIMAFKVQICDITFYGQAPEKLEVSLGDVTLEDPMPLHFYGIVDGSRLDIVRPYVNVMIQNSRGGFLHWRLHRKDTIKQLKAKLASAQSCALGQSKEQFTYLGRISLGADKGLCSGTIYGTNSWPLFQDGSGMSTDGMRLYSVVGDRNFNELDDDKTIENYRIKDGDNLFLLTYRWLYEETDVTVLKTKSKLQGVEPDETSLGIKVKVQDQMDLPASSLKLLRGSSLDITQYSSLGSRIQDTDRPLMSKEKTSLVVITMEELRAEDARRVEERKAQAEKEAEEAERQKALNEKRQREYLETKAAKAGITVEEYLLWLKRR